jgi:hypothetical protein
VERIVVKGEGVVFEVGGGRLPRAVDAQRFFHQQSEVTAQVVNSAGHCWQAVFGPEEAARNLPHLYRGRKR